MINTILLQVASIVQSAEFDYKLLMTLVSALSGAVIGGLITIWYKGKELKNLSENLNLQKQLFEENRTNNELKMKAELVRLEDLNRQYKLSLQKFDFEHLSKILDFADDKNDKVKMMREFAKSIYEFKSSVPTNILDFDEYQEFISEFVFYRLEDISKNIDSLLTDFPNVFSSIHKDFHSVSGSARYLKAQIEEYQSYSDEIGDDQLIEKFFEDLYSLYEKYNNLLEIMQEEFKELDKLKRDYIKNQFATRIKE